MFEYVIAVAAITDFLTGLFDAEETDKGIKKGVGVEDNALIKTLFSNKPSLAQLDIYNTSTLILGAAAATVAWHFQVWTLAGGAVGFLLGDAGLHVRGIKNWQYLIAGGNPNPKQSAFQKFVGFLSWHQ